ncbi:MAG: substrate-binding domain-containing protein [Spirochaetaceae bacterium]|jgi:ribose transport system substrate-binding protein|nr:substrate-binding domain-containing protein [Spirochaetaceae bacterium]
MKNILKFAALICAAGAFAACTGSGGKTDVGFSLSTLNNPFFASMKDGAESKSKAINVSVMVTDANDEPATQTKNIEDLLSKGIKVLIVNPADSAAVAPTIREVKSKGIKVIAVDRKVDGVEIDTFIGTDNIAAGQKAGEAFVAAIKASGKTPVVAVLEGVPGSSSNIERMAGYKKALDTAGIVPVVTQTANYNRDQGLTVTENILRGNPDINAIVSMNDEMALGAIAAVKSAGKIPGTDILVTGFDAGADAKAAVQKGEMLFTVEQKTVLMGETAVETAKKFIDGQSVPANIPITVEIITK